MQNSVHHREKWVLSDNLSLKISMFWLRDFCEQIYADYFSKKEYVYMHMSEEMKLLSIIAH